jgi:hypothetical protein
MHNIFIKEAYTLAGQPFFRALEKNKKKRKWMFVAFGLLAMLWIFLYIKSMITDDTEMVYILTSISILSLIAVVLCSIYFHEFFQMLLYPLAPLIIPMVYLTFTAISKRDLLASVFVHIPHVIFFLYCLIRKIFCRWELVPLGTIIWLLYIKFISFLINKQIFIYICPADITSTIVLSSGSFMTLWMIIATRHTNK